PQTKDDDIPYQEIVEYLNLKTGKNFNHQSKQTRAKIKALWGSDGRKRTLQDFQRVIDNKCRSWLTDPKMTIYLRPETLFGNKFESYLNEIQHPMAGKVSDKTIKVIETLNNWSPPQ
ncbi:MAG: conserved phage C-terminal domain-containing protein, partial [Smithellaceae bacterium]|nr:conserved phage C-terminal domain-containing protein [Smithellaceae bacterium]